MISLQGISKIFGAITALDNISFEINKGEIFGLIGPDGSGKSTLLRILATLLRPSAGHAKIGKYDVEVDYKAIRKIIGYMPGQFSLYPDLSVEENLNFFAHIFGTRLEENYFLLRDIFTYLEPFRKRRASHLSGGMKQKLALSCALIHRPTILLLDEPTTGIDPVSRAEFLMLLKNLKKHEITILISTPYMDEASACDRIALFKNGKLLGVDTPGGFREAYKRTLYSIRGIRPARLLPELRTLPSHCWVYASGNEVKVSTPNPNEIYILREMLDRSTIKQNYQIHVIEPDIEDCFIARMKDTYGE